MANEKPKRFVPNDPQKPVFRAVKGAKNTSDHNSKDGNKPLFRAVKDTQGASKNDSKDESKPVFKAVEGTQATSEKTPQKENKPLFRPAQSSSNNNRSEQKKKLERSLEFIGLPSNQQTEFQHVPKSGTSQKSSRPSSVPTHHYTDSDVSPKNGIVTLLLCLFLGVYGGHRFYSGHTGLGILYLFTGGLFLIGWIVDLIAILSSRYRDKDNRLIVI